MLASVATRDLTIPRVLRRQAECCGDKVFMTWLADGRTFTYGAMEEISNRLARGLRRAGVLSGSHVAFFMANSPEFVLLTLAIGKIGAVAVPINVGCRGATLTYFLENSDSTTIILDADRAQTFAALTTGRQAIERCIVAGQGEVPELGIPVTRYEELLEQSADAFNSDVVCSDLLFLVYTSGTTGPSKGNMLSHGAALTLGLSTVRHHGFRSDDVFYVSLPLFHINALQVATYGALLLGASIGLAPRFSVSQFWGDVARSGATVTNLLGSMAHFLWNQKPGPADGLNSLRLAASVPMPSFARGFEERFGLRLVSNYGLSDFAMVAGYTSDDPREKLGSAGRVREGYRIRIADCSDFALPAGEVGEILLRSDDPWRAASGYYGMPAATAAAQRNLWFHTGDRGYFDADGFLYFIDRAKDSIRRRGENVSAFEVERIIDGHPAVEESAAFPVAAGDSEEEVAVAIVVRPGAKVDPEDLIAYCEANMPRHMVPRYVAFRSELPRNPSQKVEKFRLRAELESGAGSCWDRGDGRS